MSFPPTSRYYSVETAVHDSPAGEPVRYLLRRFAPQPDRFTTVQEHEVVKDERLDNITARYLGDPEQFWQVCDANRALRPEELTDEVGRRLRITMPEGLPGMTNV
jgi:hypothetical protein